MFIYEIHYLFSLFSSLHIRIRKLNENFKTIYKQKLFGNSKFLI